LVLGNPNMAVSAGLFIIFVIVLLGPFLVKRIEHNLEAFLFLMGILAVTLDYTWLESKIGRESIQRPD
jgi:predicted cation transporter